jgi:ABC-2 type transport system permease protein
VSAVRVIALNELRRLAVDRTALFFWLALPVIIIVIIGTTFGATESLDVGVVDRDGSERSAALVDAVDRADGVTIERYDSLDAVRRDVRIGTLDAAVVVPAGYDGDVDRGGATVDLVSDPTSRAVAAVRTTVEAAIADEAIRSAAARFAADHGGGEPAQARATADRLADDLPAATVRTEAVGDGDGDRDLSTFSYTAPANLVLFVFINTVMVGATIANDRKRGVIRRLMATPHGTRTILAGIGAAKLLAALTQSTLLVVIGALLFDVDWGDPIAAALLVVVFAAVSTAVGVLVGTLVSDADQAQAVAAPVAIAMGMLGGCMWPLDIVPSAMRVAGHIVPHAWAMDAWIGLVFDGDGVADVAPRLAVLLGFVAVFGVVATHRLRAVLTNY